MSSIRHQLTLGLLGATGLLLALSGVLVWLLVQRALLRQFDSSLRGRAILLQEAVEEEDGMLELELNLEPLAPAGEGIVPTLFQAWSEAGESALKSESLAGQSLPRLEVPAGESLTAPSKHTLADGTRIRAVAARFDAKDDKRGLFRNVTMVTARSTQGIDSTLRLLSWVLAGTGGAALAVLVLIIRLVLARGLAPLGVLAARTSAIDVRQLHQRLPEEDTPSELRPVTARLNELLARLEDSFERERRFSSDVAHELRTPVAELKALGELVSAWPDEATPAAFAQVSAIAGEMEEVIARLTLLARSESGDQAISLEETAVDALVAEVTDRFLERAHQRGLVVESRLQPLRRRTDPALLRMIVSNLVGNAVHHAPGSSTIEIRLDADGLSVRNQAPGLSAEDMSRLFERFWRKDAARTGYGHAGLGLALAKSLAELLGDKLSGHFSQSGVLELRLQFRQPAGQH